jgi:citrate lyase subunit beta/citryl-CoA lyase
MLDSRSFLFVPGDRPDRFEKALASGAHEIILDLEDAVPPADKEKARAAIAAWEGRARAIVRINGFDSPWFTDDLAFVRKAGLSKVMIPKAEPEGVDAAAAVLGADVSFIGLVETVAGFLRVREVCQAPAVQRLAFGNLDFSLDAGMSETATQLDPIRLQLALESRFARLAAPIDGVFAAFSDQSGLASHTQRVKALGFGGKLCIHPNQVAPVNSAFLPADEELAWAIKIMAAVEAGGAGAISVDGKMVDRPVAERARGIIRASGAGEPRRS